MGAETCIQVAKSGSGAPQESCCAPHNGGVPYVGLFHSHPAKVGNQLPIISDSGCFCC